MALPPPQTNQEVLRLRGFCNRTENPWANQSARSLSLASPSLNYCACTRLLSHVWARAAPSWLTQNWAVICVTSGLRARQSRATQCACVRVYVCTHDACERASPRAGIVAVGGSCQHAQAAPRLRQGTWLTLGERVRTSHAIDCAPMHGCTRVLANK